MINIWYIEHIGTVDSVFMTLHGLNVLALLRVVVQLTEFFQTTNIRINSTITGWRQRVRASVCVWEDKERFLLETATKAKYIELHRSCPPFWRHIIYFTLRGIYFLSISSVQIIRTHYYNGYGMMRYTEYGYLSPTYELCWLKYNCTIKLIINKPYHVSKTQMRHLHITNTTTDTH